MHLTDVENPLQCIFSMSQYVACVILTEIDYLSLNNFITPNMKDLLNSANSFEANLNVRNSNADLALPKSKRKFMKKKFKFSGPKLWNCLPVEAKYAQSIYTLKNKY